MIVVSVELNPSPTNVGANASQMLPVARLIRSAQAKILVRTGGAGGGEKGHTVLRHGFILIAAATVAALAFAGSALGEKPVTVPVSFDLSAATCSQLPSGTAIHGEGTEMFSDTSSGTFHAVANGTATDGAGNTWRFNYDQNGRPVGDGGDVQLTDHFNLVGNAGVLHLHSHFVAVFSSTGDLVQLKQLTGDPMGCDPI
jgi:hypothetical protein